MFQETGAEPATDITLIGDIELEQPARGFRFNTDSLLLCLDLPVTGGGYFEIGTGTGICSILHADRDKNGCFTAIEIQKDYYQLACKNRDANNMDNIRLINEDVRIYSRDCGEKYDIIFSNPPYRKWGTGRKSHDMGRNISIYDIYLAPGELFSSGDRLMKESGAMFVVIPEENMGNYIKAAGEYGLYPKEVKSYMNRGNHRPCVISFTRKKMKTDMKTVSYEEWNDGVDRLFSKRR